jgi:hypothetical protein
MFAWPDIKIWIGEAALIQLRSSDASIYTSRNRIGSAFWVKRYWAEFGRAFLATHMGRQLSTAASFFGGSPIFANHCLGQ